MPLSSMIILIGIVSAFVAFGLALSWGEYQTRDLSRGRTEANLKPSDKEDNMKLAA
jgi:hypothetical protein